MRLRRYLSLLFILSVLLVFVSGCAEDTPKTNHYTGASTSTSATTPSSTPSSGTSLSDNVLPSELPTQTTQVHTQTTQTPTKITQTAIRSTEFPTQTTQTTPTRAPLPKADVLIDVEAIPQYPAYPTGCESVTAVMALRYAGISITVDDFIDNHLVCDNYNFYWVDGSLHGPDPYSAFVGDPRSENSYGCMAPVIESALHSCVGEQNEVINTTGNAIPYLCDTYIDQGVPVLLWATMEMRPVKEGTKWYLPNGKLFTWPSGEHCLLLIGYNDTDYFFNDPLFGTTVAYDKALVEKSYLSLGEQSLVIM